MIPEYAITIFSASIVAIIGFIVSRLKQNKFQLIHKIYIFASALFLTWLAALIAEGFISPSNTQVLFILDAITYLGCSFLPLFSFFAGITFIGDLQKPAKWWILLLIIPALTNILVWTNPYHHLFYKVFSTDQNIVVFGPYMYISGIYSYLCMGITMILMIRFAIKTDNPLKRKQAVLFSIGNIIPVIISSLSTFQIVNFGVWVTPLSFIVTIGIHGIAIYQLHMLDIMPIATQHVLDRIPDCYLIVDKENRVISFNLPFSETFASRYNIHESALLSDCLGEEDVEHKSPIYNLLSSIETCRGTLSMISYEQSLFSGHGDGTKMNYYVVDVTPLIVEEALFGFVSIFKDVTQLKESMQQLQDSRSRMMEQERLAFLGQMVGGLAHNLKTPIMSISGCTSAIENLMKECVDSADDPEVTREDYEDIDREMQDWLARIRSACAYMSDIITAIKGQAANMNAAENGSFSIDALVKQTLLLMRHELMSGGCQIRLESGVSPETTIHGDLNTLVQVMNNLISNAIHAQKQGGEIVIETEKDEKVLTLCVKDHGSGVPPRVKERLFKEMITSKGALGTGLGLYISNTLVRGKFDGSMWLSDNPGGGAVFGISIPLKNVSLAENRTQEVIEE